jgi:hypothetical protein
MPRRKGRGGFLWLTSSPPYENAPTANFPESRRYRDRRVAWPFCGKRSDISVFRKKSPLIKAEPIEDIRYIVERWGELLRPHQGTEGRR